jgi:glutaminyl-tRNA synthetase
MPTIAGMRRRGYTPASIKAFTEMAGIAKSNSTADIAMLEYCVRQDLNKTAPRVMGVLKPLKVVIDNYPEGQEESFDAVNNPEDASAGTRKVPFSRVLYIEQDDFMENPPNKFYRLSPGREVRLRYAYFITCVSVVKDDNGQVVEVHCTYDPATRGGDAPDGRKVKATMHWVSAAHALQTEVRLYTHLFDRPDPSEEAEGQDFLSYISPNSLEVLTNTFVEPSLAKAEPGAHYQFERLGYFSVDPDTSEGKLVFNRTVTLRDEWAKIQKQG